MVSALQRRAARRLRTQGACEQMRDVIAVKLSEGDSDQEIKDYFVAQYGPQVLGEPRWRVSTGLRGFCLLSSLIGGGVFVVPRQHDRRQNTGRTAGAATSSAASDSEDEYGRKLDEVEAP